MYSSQTPNENPGVLMEREEASALFDAVSRAQVRIVTACATLGRSRRTSGVHAAKLAELRADLAALEAFAKTLGEAHGIGGY